MCYIILYCVFLRQEDTFLVDEKLDAAEKISYADLLSHMRRLPSMAAGQVEHIPPSFISSDSGSSSGGSNKMYVHGHMSPEAASTLFTHVTPALRLTHIHGPTSTTDTCTSATDNSINTERRSWSCYEPSRAVSLDEAGDMTLLFPAFSPSDLNSALVSHFQVTTHPPTD
jgi:hypothetical protein